MKKLNLILVSIFALFAGVVFSACDKDSIKVDFAQEELISSVGEEIKLDDLVSVKGVSKNSIEFKVAKSTAFDFDSETKILKAKESGFSSYVYATYKGNILDSMNVVIKTSFSTPDVQTFNFENNYLSWNKVADYFENSQTATQADKYLVEGTLTKYAPGNPDQQIGVEEISEEVNENKYALTQSGRYSLTVKALAKGYFSDSARSSTWTKKIGYINTVSNLTFDAGVVAWEDTNTNARYKVKISSSTANTLFDVQTSKTLDLTTYFENATAGNYSISVVSYDTNEVLLANESEGVEIEKLETPTIDYSFSATEGGRYQVLPLSNSTSVVFEFTNADTTTLSVPTAQQSVYSSFDSLSAGEYQTYAYAVGGENTFKSDKISLGTTLKLQTPTITGLGENEENSTRLNLKVATVQNQTVATKIIAGTQILPNEIAISENEVSSYITLTSADTYSFKFKLLPKTQSSSLNVLNSTESANFEMKKLAQIAGNITHSQTQTKSTFTFGAVENATVYQVYIEKALGYQAINPDDYTLTIGQTITCEFDEKIEEMFQPIEKNSKLVYSFKIVASSNANTTIPSAATKTIEVLAAPQALEERVVTQKSIEWDEIEGASTYKVKLYALDKAGYLEYQTNGETTLGVPTTTTTETNSLAVPNVGYYLARIYSLADNIDQYIVSQDYLEVAFYVAEKLVLADVDFGFKEEYVAPISFASATGYFLKVEKTPNAYAVAVDINGSDGSVMKFSENEDYIIYLFGTDFAPSGLTTSYEISAVAQGEDQTLYIDSDAKTYTVSKLATATKGDIVLSEGPGQGKTSSIVLNSIQNARAAQIYREGYESTTLQTGADRATFNMIDLSSANLVFRFKGTELNANGIYQTEENVFLDSDEVTFAFTRLAQPTDLAYYNGNITFTSALSLSPSYSDASYFILEIANSSTPSAMPFEIKFDSSSISVTYDGDTIPFGPSSLFVSKVSSVYTINIQAIITLVKNSPLAAVYTNMQNISFRVYAWKATFDPAENQAMLSSHYAKTNIDPSSNVLQIQRVPTAVISAQTNPDLSATLSVPGVAVHEDYKHLTHYQLYENNTPKGEAQVGGGTNFTWTQSSLTPSTTYTYKVVVSNPYYLESKDSNEVTLYKLSPITTVTVGTNGTILYSLPSADAERYSRVKIVYDNGVTETTSYSDNGVITIQGAGTYALTVLGGNTQNSYVIDSDTTTFTVSNMSTLMPVDTTVSYSNNVLSWSAFAASSSLDGIFEYVVSFDDGEEVVSCATITNSISMVSNDLDELVSQLQAGTLTVRVYAHLKTYISSGTIYYASQITLLDDTQAYNYCAYTDLQTVKKLSTPDITEVQFVSSAVGAQPNAGSITPNINVVFEGNYGTTGTFNIYINGEMVESALSISKVSDTYTYTITAAQYNPSLDSGETLTVEIQAISLVHLPSTKGSVDIIRANEIESIAFAEENGSLEKRVVVTFSDDEDETTIGGVVFEIKYKATGDADYTTEYRAVSNVGNAITETLSYDISSIISTHISAGGDIIIGAFVNSYSDPTNDTYYLSSPQYVYTDQTSVLKQLSSLDITQNERGFAIDPTKNPTATYVVSYAGQTWEVEKENNEYFFEYPDTWEPGSYNIEIYAKEEGKINSANSAFAINLTRMNQIEGVTISRSALDVSQTTLSWATPTGATGSTQYLLKVFKGSTKTYETTLTGNSFTFSQIFGANYQGLINSGYYDFAENEEVFIQIITIGSGSTANSNAFGFNATIIGNSIRLNQTVGEEVINDIYVDDLGYLWFNSIEGQEYIYRLLDGAGSIQQDWRMVEATQDKTEIEIEKDANGQYKYLLDGTFNIEIVALGCATQAGVSSSTYGLTFDSPKATTYGTDVGFLINYKLESVAIDDSDKTNLLFETLAPDAFTKLEAGVALDGVKTGDVVEFVPEFTDTNYFYSYSLLELVDSMREAGLIENVNNSQTIYFWAYKQTSNATASYVISNPYSYEISLELSDSLKTILKPGTDFFTASSVDYRAVGIEGDDEDYDHIYALFENNDATDLTETIGIYVKITQIIEDGNAEPVEKTVFVPKAKLLSEAYFNDTVYAINLSEIFDDEELVDLVGRFKIELLTLKTKDDAFIISNWIQNDENNEELVFQRMTAPKNVDLQTGNLKWTNQSALSEKNYVYFYKADKEGNDYTINESVVSRCIANREVFDASSHVGEYGVYFIAVQSISQNDRILSSKRVFKTHLVQTLQKPQPIVKNQITQSLVLKDGVIKLAWPEGIDNGMYDLLFGGHPNQEAAERLYSDYFTAPFTFKLADLVKDNITIRFAFTGIAGETAGIRKTVDFNAKYLLTDFVAYINSVAEANGQQSQTAQVIQERLALLNSALQDTSVLTEFRSFIGRETNGVGNQRKIFDSIFEKIQTGKYEVQYCLLGGNGTLTSNWYNFENKENQNVLCVNPEPSMSAKREVVVGSNTENVYKLLFKKSQIYTYDDLSDQYILTDANTYVVRFTKEKNFYAFAVHDHTMYLSEAYINTTNEFLPVSGGSITVYEANADGEEVLSGQYLMIYLNLNGGDSLLGKFSDYIGKFTFETEVYAVGNDYSPSSKSAYYKTTFIGLTTEGLGLEVENGVFKWKTFDNRTTTIVYKNNSSVSEEVTTVRGGTGISEFALPNTNAGLYNTVKFVNIGEIVGNNIFVDSEIYVVNNVYKLASATLNIKIGTIEITEDQTNENYWSNCYTTNPGIKYQITNDNAYEDQYIIVTKSNDISQKLYYEAGTTGLAPSDADYTYKQTELGAEEFSTRVLGSNTKLKVNDAATLPATYHILTVCPSDSYGELQTSKGVAISSVQTNIAAKMLPSFEGLSIHNGLLTWNAYTNENIELSGAESFVYRITIEQFMASTAPTGETTTASGETQYLYTKQTSLDFKYVEVYANTALIKTTVQVVAAKVSQTPSDQHKKPLVEGGYVSENVLFTDNTPALMSNGTILANIQRLDPIDDGSLRVEDGRLVWTYTPTGDVNLNEYNFSSTYSFVVEDENNNTIEGEFTVTKVLDSSTFKITFKESVGQISAGTPHTFRVYATQGSSNSNASIKSIPRTISNVEKLERVESGDYQIASAEYSSSTSAEYSSSIKFRYEILSLENYFDSHQDSQIKITFKKPESDQLEEFNLTKDSNKVYIFRETNHEGYFIGENSIVLQSNGTYTMTMDVSKSGENILFADTSEMFTLSRVDWSENPISWNSIADQFEWDYDLVKVLIGTTASAYKLAENATLYDDEQMTQEANIEITGETYVSIIEQDSTKSKISLAGETYYLLNDDLEIEEAVLDGVNTYTVESEGVTESRISNGTKQFTVSNAAIINPLFVITASYNSETRTYQTTDRYFKPTIIGHVEVSIVIKFGNTNVESNPATTNGDFDLFENGDGTHHSPYSITNATQFKNIAYRMTKENYLSYFVANGSDREEDDKKYYFTIDDDIDLTDSETEYIDGILFKGEFNGNITGKDTTKTITYMSKTITNLSQTIQITVGNRKPLGGLNINYGSALFETLSSGAEISSLNISVKFGDKNAMQTQISSNALVCGLAIANQGTISNVNLTGYTNKFFVGSAGDIYSFYAGLVGINSGSAIISTCNIQTDMAVSGNNSYSADIALAGIAHLNSATIQNCQAGTDGTNTYQMRATCKNNADIVQVAGICTTLTSSGTITHCSNYFDISAETTGAGNSNSVYMAGIADLKAGGNVSEVTNNGNIIPPQDITLSNLHYGQEYAIQTV